MSDNIKVAVIGAGYWGKNLVRNFDSLGVLGAICDSREQTLKEFEKNYPREPTQPLYADIPSADTPSSVPGR